MLCAWQHFYSILDLARLELITPLQKSALTEKPLWLQMDRYQFKNLTK